MKKIFKIFSIIILFVLAVSTCASCGKKDKKKGGNETNNTTNTDNNNPGGNTGGNTDGGNTGGNTGGGNSYVNEEYDKLIASGQPISQLSVAAEFRSILGVSVSLPAGGQVNASKIDIEEISEGDAEGSAVVAKVTSSSVSASQYFNSLKASFGTGWISSDNSSSTVPSYSINKIVESDDEVETYSISIVISDASNNSFYIVVSHMIEDSEESLITPLTRFIKKLEEYSGVAPTLPSSWVGVLDGDPTSNKGYVDYSGMVAIGNSNPTKSDFDSFVTTITPSLTGFIKGEVEQKESYDTIYTIKWTNTDGNYFYLELESGTGYGLLTFGYKYRDSSSAGTWPTTEINEYFDNEVEIPEYTGMLGEVDVDDYYDGLYLEIDYLDDTELAAYYVTLENAGWSKYSETEDEVKYSKPYNSEFVQSQLHIMLMMNLMKSSFA